MIDKETGEVIVPFLRTPYNYDTNAASDASGLRCEDPSRTDQSFAEETDINTIVKRFGLTGQLPDAGSVRAPLEGDFHEIYDYHTAANVVRQAEEAFAAMPADVRTEFGNDPGRFMDFVHNPKNMDRAVELGLAVKKEVPPPPEPVLVKLAPDAPAVVPVST